MTQIKNRKTLPRDSKDLRLKSRSCSRDQMRPILGTKIGNST